MQKRTAFPDKRNTADTDSIDVLFRKKADGISCRRGGLKVNKRITFAFDTYGIEVLFGQARCNAMNEKWRIFKGISSVYQNRIKMQLYDNHQMRDADFFVVN